MHKIHFYWCTLLSFPLILIGQGQIEHVYGSRAEAIGSIITTLSDEFSAFNNPATLASIKKLSVGVSAKNLYTISGLNLGGLALQIPSKIGTIGVSIESIGIQDYSQSSLGLGIGKTLADGFALGAQVNVRRSTFGAFYEKRQFLSADLGVQYRILPKLELGVHFLSISGFELGNSIPQNEHPFTGRIGVQYRLSDKVFTYAELEKSIRYSTSMKLGIEYRVQENFILRGGYNTQPNSFSFGLQFSPSKAFNIHLSNHVHPTLGHSPSLSFGYQKN